jgi:hypothetical protein
MVCVRGQQMSVVIRPRSCLAERRVRLASVRRNTSLGRLSVIQRPSSDCQVNIIPVHSVLLRGLEIHSSCVFVLVEDVEIFLCHNNLVGQSVLNNKRLRDVNLVDEVGLTRSSD